VPRPTRKPPSQPTESRLHEAALFHLSRFAATEAGLTRVLKGRIDRWARASELDPEEIARLAAPLREAVPRIVAKLVAAGALNDTVFAAARTRRLAHGGKSRRAIAAHLAAKGIDAEQAQAALETVEDEVAAALVFARRRRLPPFGDTPREKALGALGRAGFSRDVAEAALRTARDEAEARIKTFRAG
jgi:regulatory protein